MTHTMTHPMTHFKVNINEQCCRFPSIDGLTIGLVNGLYDASAGILLTLKFVYDAGLLELPQMLQIFAAITAVVWIKTFFFSPYKEVNTKNSTFQDSLLKNGPCCQPKLTEGMTHLVENDSYYDSI